MSNFKRSPRQEPRNPRDRAHGPRTNNAVNRNSGPFNSNGPQNRMMSPWEGGVAPGVVNHIGSRPSGGLLPTPTLPNPVSGLLQQFSTQDVQLAYASNVLSALLPGLQSHQPNQVPSLLSLNTNRGGLLPLTPPMFQNQNFIGQGPRENAGPNRPRPVARPRPQPYNKMGNRNQRPGLKKEVHKGAYSSSSSAGRSSNAVPKNNYPQDKNIKVEVEDSKKGRKTDDPSKNKMQEEKNLKDKEKEDNAEKLKAAFSDIPSDMFYCHVCSKHMWDVPSFSNHVKGRAHQMMMDERENSYRIKIELMRHEMKVEEQQRQIALERKQRQGKSIGPQAREYCTMCDLNFTGSLAQHRKNNRHQELKSFLHPKCEDCSKEFATRLEWDQHLLTATHLKASALNKSKKQNRGGGGRVSDIFKTENDSSKDNVRNDNLKPKTEESVDKGKIDECTIPSQSPLKDSSSTNLLEKDDKLLEYDPQKEVGKEMLQEKTGYLCRCCNRFLSSSADASTHCRSQFHFDKYLLLLKNKSVIQESHQENNSESKTMKSEKSPDKCQEEREKDDDDEEDGNWKRRKVVKEDASNNKLSDVPKEDSGEPSTGNFSRGDQESSSQIVNDNQEQNYVQETSTLDKGEEKQDVPDDADKTEVQEEKQSPPKIRRGRGGTASRSRGRKRK